VIGAGAPSASIIKAEEPFDGQRFLVAVTDGSRDAAVEVNLTGTLVATLSNRGEDAFAHAFERISRAAYGSVKVEHRYQEVLIVHPYTFSA
jgi:hypothetical protein